jgi:hypothetical protein
MKKIHVFIRFHLVKISLYTLLLSSIFSCSLDSSDDSQCQGILCEFFDELNVQFEETGLEKDQGYVFLKSHLTGCISKSAERGGAPQDNR